MLARRPGRGAQNRLTSNDVLGKDFPCGKWADGHTPEPPAVPRATLGGDRMKLSDMTGHVLTIGLAGMIACSHAQPAPDASAKQDETKQEQAQPEAKPTAEEYHAQGQADPDKALEQLRGVSVFVELDSATQTKEAQAELSNVGNVLKGP